MRSLRVRLGRFGAELYGLGARLGGLGVRLGRFGAGFADLGVRLGRFGARLGGLGVRRRYAGGDCLGSAQGGKLMEQPEAARSVAAPMQQPAP
ncbi:MAG: hypothetical protein LBD24_08975 [Spirochaetaceae bacterium]|nr:hypothetical protein [Spirochaetaceae bacterium]